MFWRIVISVAVLEVLLCVLPFELAAVTSLMHLFFFSG